MTFNRIRSNNGTVNMLPTSANTVLTRTVVAILVLTAVVIGRPEPSSYVCMYIYIYI